MVDTETKAEEIDFTGLFEAEEAGAGERGIYEVGYHLVPTLSEAEVASFVKDLMDFLKKEGAEFVGEKVPEKIDLAYAIHKKMASRKIGRAHV